MPSNYTPVATPHATITVPVDGDTRNAASVSTGIKQVADNVADLDARAAELNDNQTFNGDNDFAGAVSLQGGTSLDGDDLTANTGSFIDGRDAETAGLKALALPAGGKKLIGDWPSTTSGGSGHARARLYAASQGFLLTYNARWDVTDALWYYDEHTDVAGTGNREATILRLGMGSTTTITAKAGALLGMYTGTDGWTDANFFTKRTELGLSTELAVGSLMGVAADGVMRVGYPARDVGFHEALNLIGVGGAPAFQNSATNASPGLSAAFWRDALGMVHLQGFIAVVANGDTVFTLPSGYRPSDTVRLVAVNAATPTAPVLCAVVIDSAGAVKCYGGTGFNISLDGLSFRVA